jgi:PAS domain S-box-containing protein
MADAYTYTPAIWPPLAGVVFLAAIGLYCWRRRSVPAALPLLAVSLFSIPFLLGIALEAAAVAPATKIAWFRFQGVWRAPSVTAGLCFVLEYAYPGRWLTRRNLVLLSIPALLDIFLVIISDSQLMWRRLQIGPGGSVMAYLTPAGAILAAYGVGLVLVNAAVLLWLFIRSPQHRWPVALILAGQITNRSLYVIDAAHLSWPIPLDPLAVGVLLIATTYAIALFGFQIFDPRPTARRAALEQMRDGVVVFDPEWRLTGINRAAATILGTPAARARGKRLAEILPALDNLNSCFVHEGAPAEPMTMSLGSGSSARSYEIDVSPLRDFRGLLLGHLLMLRDVTEQKRAQAQIIEHQRSLAMLREREQLARELHDGIGQVLGFASLKMGATRKLIADGKLDKADDQLAHLESAVAEAHADVRETILNLRTAPAGEKPFFASLQHYLDGCRQNYGIQVDLSVGTGVDESLFNPEAQMQLFRILQEAFSNARKHAEMDRMRASFELEDGLLRMCLQDNGKGFDPRQTIAAESAHFGLRFMRERAEQLGGSLQVNSAPGQGTCVEVTVPVREKARRHGDERCAY